MMWIMGPVTWHSDRVKDWPYPRFLNWYTADWDYGLGTVYFFTATIGIFALANILFQYRTRSAKTGLQPSTLYGRLLGLLRYFAAKQYQVRAFGFYSPPLGAIVMVCVMSLFFLVLSLAVRTYYWPNRTSGDSPPLATRSGWIAIGIMPFLLALSPKVNLVGLLTGTSHEKLQVFHRWTGVIMYIASLMHTFPFIIWDARGGELHGLQTRDPFYWTGVAALVPQTWLIIMSWGPIRNRYYETFKKLHFIASGIFMAALFIHCQFILTSWDYIWATAAIYGVSWFSRVGRMLIRNGVGHRATFQSLPGNSVKITVPTTLRWNPGQHYFIRFIGMGKHAFTSHPFTVCSLPTVDGKGSTLEMYVKAYDGMTSRLDSFAQSSRSCRVILDGPYGGIEGSLRVYDKVFLLAGGSGASFIIPLLTDLARGSKEGINCKHIQVIWAVSHADTIPAFQEEIDAALSTVNDGTLQVTIHVTNTTRSPSPNYSNEDEKDDKTALGHASGRPNLPQIVAHYCDTNSTVGIAACGPNSFTLDVRNAVARYQMQIARGTARSTEVYLHTESYSW